jgi:anhydro-N-acetylmuramic acid kinase
VPIGDSLLFGNYTFCLNLGGFANISFVENGERIAFDVVPVNTVLNTMAQRLGLEFDRNGEIASVGNIIPELLEKLDSLPYYNTNPPKSLGREWTEQNIFPVLDRLQNPIPDILRTFVEHICTQIGKTTARFETGSLFVTGGGAHNKFLINRLQEISRHKIVVPGKTIVDYKEALIFAFLGWLRVGNRINVLSSYTGASRDSVSGIVVD